MSALRQEAISMISVLPEQYLSVLVQQMRDYEKEVSESEEDKLERARKAYENLMAVVERRAAEERAKMEEEKDRYAMPCTQEELDAFMARQEIDPKKAAAFDELETFLREHPVIVDENFDYDQARWEALNEKYGPFA